MFLVSADSASVPPHLGPCDLATPNFLPIPSTPGPWLFPGCSLAWPMVGFSYDSSPSFISEVKLFQSVNRKRQVRWDFGEGPRKKNHRVIDQEGGLSSARSGGHFGVWSLWLAWHGLWEQHFSQKCPNATRSMGPHACLKGDFSLLRPLEPKDSFLPLGRSLWMEKCWRADEELSTIVLCCSLPCHSQISEPCVSPQTWNSFTICSSYFFFSPDLYHCSFFYSFIYSVLSPFKCASCSMSFSYPLSASVSTIPLPFLSPPVSHSVFQLSALVEWLTFQALVLGDPGRNSGSALNRQITLGKLLLLWALISFCVIWE